jgi:hypothetical protein
MALERYALCLACRGGAEGGCKLKPAYGRHRHGLRRYRRRSAVHPHGQIRDEQWPLPFHRRTQLCRHRQCGGNRKPQLPNLTAASLGSETFLGTGAAGYRFVDTGGYWIDGVAGFRYTWTKTDLSFNLAGGGVLNGGEEENWLDGFVGARGAVKLDSRWSLLGYADVGGGGSNYTWQAYAGVDYELNPNTHLFGGYRAYKDEYENDDGYLYSILQQGPIIGATFWF